jgi:beta-lactamase class A
MRAPSIAVSPLLPRCRRHAREHPRGFAPSAILRTRIGVAGAEVAVYFRELTRPDSLALNADTRFHAASTMKVAVMIQVFRDADAGRLDLRARIPVANVFRSIADSATFSVDSADDSDRTLYRQVGREMRIEELVRLMITRSSNLATTLLITQVGADRYAPRCTTWRRLSACCAASRMAPLIAPASTTHDGPRPRHHDGGHRQWRGGRRRRVWSDVRDHE